MDQSAAQRRNLLGQNLLRRLLGLFAEVHPSETVTAVLMFTNIFLILTAYYILKTVREGMIVGGVTLFGIHGDEVKIYLSALMALLLFAIVPAYGALASAVSRARLLNICVGLVVGCLAAFFVLGRMGTNLGIAFFLWLGIVNVFLIAQFWSYANDIYSEEQGQRLFPIIAVGQSAGSILGPRIAEAAKRYTFGLMAGAAGLLSLCLLLYNIINKREQKHAVDHANPSADKRAEQPLSKDGGFALVFRSKYLLLIAAMMLLANLVNTTGEFILSHAAKTYAAREVPKTAFAQISNADQRASAIRSARTAVVTGFYGSFFFWVNLVGFVIQAFAVSRIFKYLGVRVALCFLPLIALGAYGAIGVIGGLTLLRIAKTAENSTDYSLQNTVRQALFLPTSREAKYKAKAAIDTFFIRIGDSLAAGVVAVGIHALSLNARAFAFVNVVLVAVWLVVVRAIAVEHKRLVPPGE